MINKVILVGNLGKDPEIRDISEGVKVAQFSLATNERYRDKNSGEWKDKTEWHNITCWRYLAENAERNLRKGSLAYIEGKLSTRKYQDKDGIERYTTDVVAVVLKSLDRRNTGSAPPFPSEVPDDQVAFSGNNVEVNNTGTQSSQSNVEESAEDDLPF